MTSFSIKVSIFCFFEINDLILKRDARNRKVIISYSFVFLKYMFILKGHYDCYLTFIPESFFCIYFRVGYSN